MNLSAQEDVHVFASHSILADVAAQVAGDVLEIHALIPPGADPHAEHMSARDVAELLGADLIFLNGARYEEGVIAQILQAEKQLPVVVISSCVALWHVLLDIDYEAEAHDHAHDHADEDDHAHEDHGDDDHADDDHTDEDHADDDHDEDDHADEDHDDDHDDHDEDDHADDHHDDDDHADEDHDDEDHDEDDHADEDHDDDHEDHDEDDHADDHHADDHHDDDDHADEDHDDEDHADDDHADEMAGEENLVEHCQELRAELSLPSVPGEALFAANHCDDEHENETGEAEDHEGIVHDCDPHVWLDVHNVMLWTVSIRDELSALLPEHASAFAANAASYLQDLRELDQFLQEQLQDPSISRQLVTAHESLQYFAHRYGFINDPVLRNFSSISAPDPGEIAALIDRWTAEGVRALFQAATERNPLLEQLAVELDVSLVTIYIEALSGSDGPADTYLNFMRQNAQRIVTALTDGASE
ncbi:MAG: zinc ABC transporter substrate-binding protein [Chloroflexi bacterium]|nr:zinc ABC transporter substrate-binding protein [Chloroflexota bacterium]